MNTYRVMMAPIFNQEPEHLLVDGDDIEWGDSYVRVLRFGEEGEEETTFVAATPFVRAICIDPKGSTP